MVCVLGWLYGRIDGPQSVSVSKGGIRESCLVYLRSDAVKLELSANQRPTTPYIRLLGLLALIMALQNPWQMTIAISSNLKRTHRRGLLNGVGLEGTGCCWYGALECESIVGAQRRVAVTPNVVERPWGNPMRWPWLCVTISPSTPSPLSSVDSGRTATRKSPREECLFAL